MNQIKMKRFAEHMPDEATQLKVDKELRIEKLKSRIIIEITQSIIYFTDERGKITFISSGGRFFGYEYSHAIGRELLEFVNSDDKRFVREKLRLSFENEVSEPFIFRVVTSAGENVEVEASGKSMRDGRGGFYHYVGVLRNITKQKEMEEELRQSDVKFRTIVENMYDLVYTYDTNGNMRFMSPSCHAYGYREEDFINRPVTDFFHRDDHPIIYEAAGRGMAGELFTLILRFLTKEGKVKYMEVTGKVSHFYEGIAFFTGVAHDINDRKIAEEKLEKAHRELVRSYELLETRVEERTRELAEVNSNLLEEIRERTRLTEKLKEEVSKRTKLAEMLSRKNRELDDFTSVVSHDLKNHLFALMNVWRSADLSPEAHRQRVNELAAVSERLIVFIDNLLRLAKSGRTIRDKKDVMLGPLVQELFDRLNPPDWDGKLIVKGGKVQTLCDPDAMALVFSNLIMNAFHHGDPEKKGIEIRVTVKRIDRGTLITFEDNGIGIKKENMPELFHPGYTTIEGKTGFGLPIVKKIVEAHDGTIGAVSEGPGKGAQFHIILPEE